MGIFTIIAIGAALLAGGASYVQAKQAQKKAKKLANSMAGVLLNKESNIEPLPVVYGTRRVGGVRVFVETSGPNNEYLYIALALCEGEVGSIAGIEIDGISRFDSRFSGLVAFTTHTGADDQSVSSLLIGAPSWTTNHRLRGVAYLGIRLKWDQNVFSGIPEITALVTGKRVYDPRTGNTTWSSNPALCIRDYLTNERYGKGLPASAIDDTAFAAAANDCDSFSVTPYSGATSNIDLFQCNAVIDTGEEIFRNVEKMLLGCRGFLPYTQGKYALYIDQSKTHTLDLTLDNIIGGISFAGEKKEDKFNRVIVKFANPNTKWQEDAAIWPDAGSTEESTYLGEDNDVLLVDEVEMETITNYYAARDFARIFLLRSRNGMRVSLQATSEAINLVVGDVVRLTHPTPSFTNKPFQVEQVTLNYDGTVNLDLLEYDSTIYTYDQAAEETDYPDTDLPDPFTIAEPTALTLTESTRTEGDGTTIPSVLVQWTAADDFFVSSYEVQYKLQAASTYKSLITGATEFDITLPESGADYDIRVRSINSAGVRSGFISDQISIVGDNVAPGTPANASVAADTHLLIVTWDNPSDSDFSYTEIKRSPNTTEANAVVIARVDGESYADGPFSVGTTRYYWLRAVDRTGNASAWVYADGETTVALAAGDLEGDLVNTGLYRGIVTNDALAPSNAEFSSVAGRNPRDGDLAITVDTTASPDAYYAWEYNGSSWDSIPNLISGNLLVDGSITANQIAADAVTADKIDVTNLAAINSDLGTLTAGTINASVVTVSNINASNISTGSLSADRISIDGVTIDTDGSGNLIIADGGVGSTQLSDGAVSNAKLGSGSVSLSNIIEGSVSKVNPVTQTGNIYRWAGYDDAGNVVNAVPSGITVEYDATERALELTNDGNVAMRSDTFVIDQNSIYKVSFKAKKSIDTGTWYLGTYQATSPVTGSVSDGGNLQTQVNFTKYAGGNRASSSDTNAYFWNGSGATYTEYVFYLMGANVDIDEVPQASETSQFPYIQVAGDAYKHVGLRFLNWGNSGTTTSLFIKDLSVVEMTATTIIADNISTTNLAAISSDLGAITAGSLNIGSGNFIVSSAGVMTATGADVSGAITATSLTLSGTSITESQLASDVQDSLTLADSALQIGDIAEIISAGNIPTGQLTFNDTGSKTVSYDGNNISVTGGNDNSWDTQVYSSEHYASPCVLQFEATFNSTYRFMMGLNEDPTTNASYASIDYCWYLNASYATIYQSGSQTAPDGGAFSYSVGDKFSIVYDGDNIYYYHNDTLKRTVTGVGAKDFYLDSSLYDTAISINDVRFAPISRIDYGSIGGVTITPGKLYQGTGTFNNANTGFYLDSAGSFSLKDKLAFFPSNNTLRVKGNIEADVITVNQNLQVVGDLKASSLAIASITREMFTQDALDEIYGALATAVGGSNGDYKEASGSFTTSGGTVTLALFDHGESNVVVEWLENYGFAQTTDYTGTALQATLTFEASTTSNFATIAASKTETITLGKYDLSVYYGSTYIWYYGPRSVIKTFTTSDLADTTDYYFRVRVTSVGAAFTGITYPFEVEANEGVTGVVSTGGNADTLDNLDSTAFLRSNVDDTFDGNLVVTGNLTVNGTTVTLNTATLDVEDKNITLNYGAGDTSASANGAGITIQDAVNASTDASLTWNATGDYWNLSHQLQAPSIISAGTISSQYFVSYGGGELILAAGESQAQLVGVTGGNPLQAEYVYAVAESGLQVISSPNNWISGANSYNDATWAQRNVATINKSDGQSDFPAQINVEGHGNSSQWNTAYGWGNHASAGYLAASSYTAADVLAKIKTVDGASSGLDADTVDGIQSANIIYGSNSSGTNQYTFTDWNAINKSGFYSDDAASNRWSSAANWSSLIHVKLYSDNNAYASQLGFNTYDNRMFARTNNGGTWTGWDEIWHSGSDGSGSGLDADLLDGQQGSYYQPASSAITNSTTQSNHLYIRNANPTIYLRDTDHLPSMLHQNSSKFYVLRGATNDATTWNSHASGAANNAAGRWPLEIDITDAGNYVRFASSAVSAGGYTVWHSGNDGSGSTLDADTVDGYHASNFARGDATWTSAAGWRQIFHSGAGGASFPNNHYSMGVDYANGAWSNPNYSDLIIGYHTGIRIGGAYSGVRFYNNSPTTDANNDGNGDGNEVLLMTVGGGGTSTSGAHVYIENSLYIKNGGSTNNVAWNAGNDGSSSGLDADMLDGRHLSAVWPAHSGSDFVNGTLVTTNIPANTQNGASFVIEVTGKSYSANPPFSFIAQGYLYNNTIIAYSGINLSGYGPSEIKMFEDSNGYLAFWWGRISYWNSFSVHVRNANGTSDNCVTNITNSAEPSSSKKVTVTLTKTWTNANHGSGSGLDADLLDGVHGSSFLRSDASDNYTGGTLSFNSGTALKMLNGSNFDASSGDVYANFRVIRNAGTANLDGLYIGYQNSNSGLTRIFGGGQGSGGIYISGSGANDIKFNNSSVFWHAGNDGSGSGLDADTVDGLDSASFVRADASDTMAGHLIVQHNGVTTTPGYTQGQVELYTSSNYVPALGFHRAGYSATTLYENDGQLYVNPWVTRAQAGLLLSSGNIGSYAWTSANDGSGSGLDADTVDGIQAASFLRSDANDVLSADLNQTGGSFISHGFQTSDLNAMWQVAGTGKDRGLAPFRYQNDAANKPESGDNAHWGLNIYAHAGSSGNYPYGHQLTAASSGNIWQRWVSNGGFGSWKKLWDSGNDGSGSGLDADTVDGIQAASFLRSDAADTAAGKITFSTGIARNNHNVGHLEGSYNNVGANSDKTNPIYTIGSNYNPTTTSVAGMYGIGYAHPNLWGSGKSTGWGMYVVENGTIHTTLSIGGLWSKGSIFSDTQGTLWGASNDGSGSGLDADLLDGQHGSYYAIYDHIRSLGAPAFTGGDNPSITTEQLFNEMDSDGAFDSYTSVFKTSWSYAGNYDLTDAGRFTETAGTSWITWTDNASDSARGNYTALAIAPTTGGSAGKVFIYNNQGSGYAPGWREVWTSTSDGSGSGLDADLLDGIDSGSFARRDVNNTYASNTINYFWVERGGYCGSLNTASLQAYTTGGNSAFMSFHRSGAYAVNMGLDEDNVLRIGGWSASANRWVLDMSGNMTAAGNVTAYSDIRLKENIKVIPNALEKVQNIRGVTFTRNDQEDKDKLHTGVIAQEVEKVLPEVISEDNLGIKNVAYGNMVGLLIEAIKELKAEVDDLKTQLKEK